MDEPQGMGNGVSEGETPDVLAEAGDAVPIAVRPDIEADIVTYQTQLDAMGGTSCVN